MEGFKRNYLRPPGYGLKLHLGCGDYWFEGYLNIDLGVYGGTDMIYDISTKLPFQDHVVQIIECYEVLEHFDPAVVDTMIEDWKRLFINGGFVRLSVPDMDKLVEEYNTNKNRIIEE